MSVYVDCADIPFGRMKMSHLWADTLPELLVMADRIGVQRKWLQQPPKASWVHFDVSLGKKALAIEAGAILTDIYGPALHVAKLRGDERMIALVERSRLRRSKQGPMTE